MQQILFSFPPKKYNQLFLNKKMSENVPFITKSLNLKKCPVMSKAVFQAIFKKEKKWH